MIALNLIEDIVFSSSLEMFRVRSLCILKSIIDFVIFHPVVVFPHIYILLPSRLLCGHSRPRLTRDSTTGIVDVCGSTEENTRHDLKAVKILQFSSGTARSTRTTPPKVLCPMTNVLGPDLSDEGPVLLARSNLREARLTDPTYAPAQRSNLDCTAKRKVSITYFFASDVCGLLPNDNAQTRND
jgi:hypothetical protein